MRLGLCCQFAKQPIKFGIATAVVCRKLPRPAQLAKLSLLCLNNARALEQAIQWCASHQVGAFRILSQLWPLKTHPECGYELADLPDAPAIANQLSNCRALAAQQNIRLSFHPDQFVVLNSPREEVVASSLAELEYQAEVAELVGADVVNIHGGGAYGDKASALERFRSNLPRLSKRARERLTLENDDKVYTPADLLPLCEAEGIPLCYDVHHHRCLPDGRTVEETTTLARRTWHGREPLFHLSSPLAGWSEPRPQLHHDYIDPADVPAEWLEFPLTVDVEAKAKELAVLQLQASLNSRRSTAPTAAVSPKPASQTTCRTRAK